MAKAKILSRLRGPKWYTSTENSDYYAYGDASKNLYDGTGKADWEYNTIYKGGNKENIWRTLTSDEWTYLINIYGNHSKRLVRVNGEYKAPCGLGKIGEVNGLILLPDNRDGTVDASFNHFKYNSSTYGDNEYTTDEWQAMEAAGVVFLPAAGIVQNVSFENGNINIGRGERDYGCSVHLVYKLPE